MAIITLSNLTFAYDGGDELFSDVSLQIETRWKLGLIGRNGRGKTTFLNLLRGRLEHGGRIAVPLPVDYFPYDVEDPGRRTLEIVEEIADFEPWQLARELSLLSVDEEVLERPFETLSGGERTKTLLAALFLKEEHFLLIDEPTNHLDREGREIVGDYLRTKKGFLLVSHDRALLDRCVDHVLSINRSGLELVRGNFATWQRGRDERAVFENAENRKLRKEVRRLENSARKSAGWSDKAEKEKYGGGPVDRGFLGAKAAKKMQQAKSTEARRFKAAEEKSKLFRDVEVEDVLTLAPLPYHAHRLVDAAGLALRCGDRILFENLSFEIDAGDRIALCGRNGCGKSSLLRRLTGESTACACMQWEGFCRIPTSLEISYLPQDTSFLRGDLRDFIHDRKLDESLYRALLHKLGFSGDEIETDMADFSAGQKKKVLLAADLSERAHLYLWDEPLNYIDVISRMQIEKLLVDSGATVVFVEHDEAFLDAVATKRIEL